MPVVSKFEGGYANNPNDLGKETYRGVSRHYNQKPAEPPKAQDYFNEKQILQCATWQLWDYIDKLKAAFNKPIIHNKRLSLVDQNMWVELIMYW